MDTTQGLLLYVHAQGESRRQISFGLDHRNSKPFPWLHITPPLESRLISDGVASTY
jgi:hypothetical protein